MPTRFFGVHMLCSNLGAGLVGWLFLFIYFPINSLVFFRYKFYASIELEQEAVIALAVKMASMDKAAAKPLTTSIVVTNKATEMYEAGE